MQQLSIEKRLEEMVSNGAFFHDGSFGHTVASARIIQDGELHYVFAFDDSSHWDHVLEFENFVDDGYYLNFKSASGDLLATLAPVEPGEEIECWEAWQDYIKTPAGMAVLESIERAYQVHRTWK
jgi:hypothetical protein